MDIEKFLKGFKLPKLSVEQAELMEGSISLEEIQGAIQALKINTAPGLVRYTPEFYKKFSNKLSLHLHKLFQACSTGYMERHQDYSNTKTWERLDISSII